MKLLRGMGLPLSLVLATALSPPVYADTIETALNAYSEGNYTNALEILQRLAREGEARAQYNLGAMYDAGSGVEEDNEVAVKWYSAAAEQGIASAAFNLGNMFREGHGVEKSYEQAVSWYERAATLGDSSAQYNLGAMYENGYGTERDLDKAVEWYRKAADQGLVHAQHRLGTLYLKGEGLQEDRITAFSWLNKAASQGYDPAKQDLSSLENEIAKMRRQIRGSNVNLRANPSTSAGVLGRLRRGQNVLAVATEGEWVEVDVVNGKSLRGWVHASLLR